MKNQIYNNLLYTTILEIITIHEHNTHIRTTIYCDAHRKLLGNCQLLRDLYELYD